MPQPRLLLADDHRETADLLAELLETEFDVIGRVEDGVALVSAVEKLAPDVIVSDISRPYLDGISAATAILRRNPAARIVLIPSTPTRCWRSAACRPAPWLIY